MTVSIAHGAKKHLKWLIVLAVILVVAAVVFVVMEYRSWKYLGEGIYTYSEHDNDLTFDQVKENLQNAGFSVERAESMDYQGETVYALRREEEADLLLIRCDTVLHAKCVFECCLNFDLSPEHEHALTRSPMDCPILRVNDFVLMPVSNGDAFPRELFEALQLQTPRATRLVRCRNIVYLDELTYEHVCQDALDMEYSFYSSEYLTEELYEQYAFLVSPDRSAGIALAKPPVSYEGEDDLVVGAVKNTLYELYMELWMPEGMDYTASAKMVVLSDGSFLLGLGENIDAFLEQINGKQIG